MKNRYQLFLQKGERWYSDPGQRRASLVLNQFLIVAFGCTVIAALTNIIVDRSVVPIFYAPIILSVVITSWLLNTRGYFSVAVISIFVFLDALLSFFTIELGVEGLAFLYFFPIMLGLMFLLSDERHTKLFVFLFGLTLLSGIFTLGFALYGFRFGTEFLDPVRNTSPYLNTPLSFLMMTYLVTVFLRMQKRKEKSLQLMINEKQTLLSEVHHRVKNNLAIISSLLNLQKNSSEDTAIQRALDDSRNRIYTMALIHEKLYKNQTFSSIGFSDYAESLLHEYVRSSLKTKISKDVAIDNINLVLGQAIPCGLILNELITNSVKHGFKDKKEGSISLKMWKEKERIMLDFRDTGNGIEDIIRLKEQETLGMTIIHSLTEQLNGDISFSNESGLRVRLSFPEQFEREIPS